MKISKKELGALVLAFPGSILDLTSKFFDRGIYPALLNHVGDFSDALVMTGIGVLASSKIEKFGKEKNLKYIEKFGHYLPEISLALTGAYISLGESIFPKIMPGTADIKDIPAGVLGAIAGYITCSILKDANKKETGENEN